VRRTEWDKFAGAHYTIAFDLPLAGARTLQLGSVHHYRDNFSVPYGIRYEAPDGSERHVHQTTFGLSERLLGAVVGAHGDGRGVVFPSEVAPYEIVVVPILSGTGAPAVAQAARDVTQELGRAGRRTTLDDGDDRPGAKYYRWELAGAPLRLEVGSRELERGRLTAVDRLGRKSEVGRATLAADVGALLEAFDSELRHRAAEAFRDSIAPAARLDELTNSPKVRLIGWCGAEECGHAVERAIDGALLGTPEEPLPFPFPPPSACIACGRTEGLRVALAAQPM
jgi:prolyl-tRNA synthetase